MQHHKLLQELCYDRHLNKTPSVFAKAVDKVLSNLGEHSKDALISHISSITKIPEDDCFVYYSITKNALEHVFGEKSAREILDLVKEEIILQNGHSSQDSLDKIMSDLSKEELLDFVHNLHGGHHILYLYNDEEKRNEIMSEFFSSKKSANGLLSIKPTNLRHTKNLLYEDILHDDSKSKDKIIEFISKIQSENHQDGPIRIFGEDVSLWLKNGTTDRCLEAEGFFNKNIDENSTSIICACDASGVPDEKVLSQLISCHNYVITEEPYIVYRRGV